LIAIIDEDPYDAESTSSCSVH